MPVNTCLHKFHAGQLESLSFKTLDDFTGEATLDSIRLDGNEGTFAHHDDEWSEVVGEV